MNKFKFKLLMFILVAVVGSIVVTAIDMAVGLTPTLQEIGFFKSGFHKMGYLLQGMALAWVLGLPND